MRNNIIEIEIRFKTPKGRKSKYYQRFKVKRINEFTDKDKEYAVNFAKTKCIEWAKENFKQELKKGYVIDTIEIIHNSWNINL
jgi:hypothetical protein